jgi:hypothetical protein
MPAMAAAADPAKTAPFRDRFATIAFNAFAITRPIYVSGCEADCAPQHAPSANPANQRRFQDAGFPIMIGASASDLQALST